MNLLSLISGVFGLLTGDKDSEGNHMYLGDVADDGYVESNEQYTNLGGALDNFGKKITGSGLTRAEQQANAFTAQREDLAWERQMEASNTAYQRQVADMQAAGINPMMAVSGSGGAAVPSASAHGSVAPSGGSFNLGSLISAIVGAKQAKADINLKNAEADKIRSETDFFNSMKSIRRQAETLQNQLTEKEIEKGDSIIKELAARADNELSQAVYNRANTRNLEYLQPFVAKELESRSSSNEANAKYALVQAAYQQGLIDEGIVAAAVRLENAKASESEVNALVGKFMAALTQKEVHNTPDIITGSIGEKIVGVINAASKAIQGKLK